MVSSIAFSSSSFSGKKLSQQNSVFRRRQSTVIKKAQELSTLCGIDVCVICYGPDGSLQTWPQDIDKIRDIDFKYRSLDDTLRRKRSLNLSSFLNKIEHSHGHDSMDLTIKVDGFSSDRFSELGGLLERNILCLKQRLTFIESEKYKTAANKKIDDVQISSSCQSIFGQTQSVNLPINPRIFFGFVMDEQNAAAMLGGNAFPDNGCNNSPQYAYYNPGFNRTMIPERRRRRVIQQNLMINGCGSGGALQRFRVSKKGDGR
ncbi:PREDICTED: agamous-like MADS-box protein AGL81 [Tarenaya hassleriana]|uniref:agamous-like MADS-box protein AGL81 n=1 Tax=Tarenaya hassleriana TaxID=28532 RepID=UPI00053C95C0|nr:PREDICTED: agamous-like MADS-box protein AGL81 [Tarenaya hassleriana]